MDRLIVSLSSIIWRPQACPQKALVDCPLSEVFFGGARGGGKTDGVLGKWALKEQRYGAAFNAIMLRRTAVSSEDASSAPNRFMGRWARRSARARRRGGCRTADASRSLISIPWTMRMNIRVTIAFGL